MECPFCEDPEDIEHWDRDDIVDHLVITVDSTGHVHTHGPTDSERMEFFKKILDGYCKKITKKGKGWGKKKLTAGKEEAKA